MNVPSRLWLLPLATAIVLAGCGGKSGNTSATPTQPGGTIGASQDRAEVASALAQSPEVVEDGAFETADRWSIGSGDALSAIHPLAWFRVIRDVDRTYEFAFSDTDSTGRPTRAVVTVHKRLRGTFAIVSGPADPDSTTRDSLALTRKPLVDHWVRRILLRRVRENGDGDREPKWRVAATSGVEVTSRDATTHIVSLRIQSAALDTTITNPRAFWFLRRLVRVVAEEPVTLTVTTERNDDVVVLVHHFARFRFQNNGDGTYTGTWRAPLLSGIRHFGVNALSHGTLFDDEAPYDSQAWILPYVVQGQEVAEYLPSP